MSTPVDLKTPILFGCTNCGKCCQRPGKVIMRLEEADRAEQVAMMHNIHLNLEVSKDAPWIKRLDAPNGCPLHDATNNRCRMGDGRPEACRAFPFWPHLLQDRDLFEAAKSECEGIDNPEGELYPAKRVLKILRHVEGT